MSTALRVSEAASLGLHTMGVLAAHAAGPLTTGEVASALGVSQAHLSKVLQRLGRSGLVTSERGPSGGFTLARPAEEITLLSVYEAIEGPLSLDDCLLGEPRCDNGRCVFGGLLASVNTEFADYLTETRVSDLAECLSAIA